MIRLKKILVPTDFSPHSEVALRYACEFAEKFGAELHFLHVVQELFAGNGFYALPANYFEEVQAESERRLAAIPDSKSSAGKTVVRKAIIGVPFVEIIRYAKANGIDMIVMGTHGRGAVAHLLMGSVAERVVRKAPCPVLTVRDPEHKFVMP
jgi:nucleotide-binding universal stress UspA family protein